MVILVNFSRFLSDWLFFLGGEGGGRVPPKVALARLISVDNLIITATGFNTQTVRFHVENNSMKEFMWSIEMDMTRSLNI